MFGRSAIQDIWKICLADRRYKIFDKSLWQIGGRAISWQSKLQKCVALSTTVAEYIATTEASKDMIWLKWFLQDMNKEFEPSFRLGVSQLECFKESQEVVNFVPRDFDYEIDGFHENRSKHRYDPQTVKKLRQKITKKDKKKESGSKKRGHNIPESKAPVKRRRVVKEICRDDLPKVEQPNQEEIHVFVKGQILRFSINEFALIFGLKYFGNVDDFKYEDSSPSRLMKRLMASLRQEFSMEKQLYRLSGIPQVLNMWMFELCSNVESKVAIKEGNNIPRILNWKVVAVRPQFNQFVTGMFSKYSYANIVPTADEFEKLDLARTDFASEQHGTSLMPSSSKNQDRRRYKVNVSQVTEDHHSFDDFNSTPPRFLMRQSIHVSRTVSELITKTGKDVPTGRRSDHKKQTQLLDTEKKNRQQETIVKQSRQECDPSDAVVDNARPTSTDSVVKETDKPDVGIEKQSDIAVEEIQQLESIIPGRELDLALTIYKPTPTTPAEYEISDTVILSAFSTSQKNVSANKNAPAPRSRKPSKIYRSPFLTHFGSSSKEKKNLASNEQKKFPFEGYHITGDSPTVEMKIFEEWIHDGLYTQHTKKKDDDDHYKVNCSTLGFRQLDFVVAFPKFKNWFYLMYQQNKCWNDEHLDVIMYYLRKNYKNTNFPISRYTTTDYFFKVYIDKAYVNYYNSNVTKDLATQDKSARTDEVVDMEQSLINTIKRLSTCVGQSWHMVNENNVPTDWTALKSYEEKSERDPFQVEYVSEIAQQDSGTLDCGVFMAVYAEYLSEGLGISCSGIDA
ncbi:hypothetical protein BC332_32778 [Capsicum chinense]|nr:hypothetical protein BC332_32778 [Capsicum chinense]